MSNRAIDEGVEKHLVDRDTIRPNFASKDYVENWETLGFICLLTAGAIIYGVNRFIIQPVRKISFLANGNEIVCVDRDGFFPYWTQIGDKKYNVPNLI